MPTLKYAGTISGARLVPADKGETKLIFNFSVILRSEIGFSSMPAVAKLTGNPVYISIYGDQLSFPETDDAVDFPPIETTANDNQPETTQTEMFDANAQ